MQNSQAAVLNALVRVQRFLDANDAILGKINQSVPRATLDDVVEALDAHAVSQTGAHREAVAESAKERVLRNTLKLNHMRPVAAIAISQLREVPEFVALEMPRATIPSRQLVAAAKAMADGSEKYAATFVASGLESDFVAQLSAAAQALADCLANKGESRNIRSGATAGLNAEVSRGRHVVKVLDALVEPKLGGDVALLTQWNAAKRMFGKTSPVASTTIDAAAKGPTPENLPSEPSASDGGGSSTGAPIALTSNTVAAASSAPSKPAAAAQAA